jgi:hypothetical protein
LAKSSSALASLSFRVRLFTKDNDLLKASWVVPLTVALADAIGESVLRSGSIVNVRAILTGDSALSELFSGPDSGIFTLLFGGSAISDVP